MPNRAQRRAAERQAQKLAVNASKVMFAEQTPTGRPETMAATAPVGGSDQPPPPDTFNFQNLIDEKSRQRKLPKGNFFRPCPLIFIGE